MDEGLVVGLAPFSIRLVEDTFMAVEQPEPPGGYAAHPGEPLTIGQFYRQVRHTLVTLGDGAFAGGPRHQVTTDLLPGAIGVTGVASACQAIDTIIDQGEGTCHSPLEVVGTDVAHYYRFAEIVRGRRLIRMPHGRRWAYLGEPVTVNPAGIRGVPANPALAAYPDGSAAYRACKSFNYTYTSLLKVLHAAFNGAPAELMSAFSLMGSLQQQATDMMTGTTTNGVPAGPSFQWQPTD